MVKISQWVIRHYQLSAENDCPGEVMCPSSQGPDRRPSVNKQMVFPPPSPNFASKKRIQYYMCESKHTLKYKWLISVYTHSTNHPPTHTHNKTKPLANDLTELVKCDYYGARYGPPKRPYVKKSWHNLSTSRLVQSSKCPGLGRLMQY